jgi:hypothetical protein
MFSPAIGDGSWPSYLAAGVRANDTAVILCAQKLTSWQLREDLTDLKRDECKSAYGIHSGRTSYRLLAVQTVLLRGHRRSSDERNWTASQLLPDRTDVNYTGSGRSTGRNPEKNRTTGSRNMILRSFPC